MSTRRWLRLATLLVPAVLLGVGWWLTSLREAALERDEAARVQTATAGRIRAVVDASLEELRQREDRRPFYLYNHYYSPPDVLAVVDPVAVSPLARAPTDPRVLGHLQLDPDGTLRVPYTPSGAAEGNVRAERVLSGVNDDMVGRLRALTRADPQALAAAKQLQQRLERNDVDEKAPQQQVALNSDVGNAYTVSLNSWSNRLAKDIQEYTTRGTDEEQQPADESYFKQQRVAPKTKRRIIPEPTPPAAKSKRGVSKAPSKVTVLPPPVPPANDGQVSEVTQAQAARPPQAMPPPNPQAARPPAVRAAALRRQHDTEEVDYTEMRWAPIDDELLLVRTVSHGGVTSAQAVRIDLEHVREVWLPQLVRAHAPLEQNVWLAHAGVACASPVSVSDVLPGAALCFDATHRGGAPVAQGLLLLLLLGAVALAGVTTVRAEQRSADLAAQQGAFVSAVSHELRTPLTTIRMNAEMLADGLVSEGKRKTFLERQVSESVRLSHLVENVLEVSRMDAGQRRMRLAEGDLGRHVADVVSSQRPFLASKGAAVEVTVPASPVVARFDAQAVEQIVINLLENGAKYGRAAEHEGASLHVEVSAVGQRATLVVSDEGPGIAADAREKVFERFFRARRADDTHVVGTGLGLSLVRDLARAHGGDARLLPVEQGCAVEITLPLLSA